MMKYNFRHHIEPFRVKKLYFNFLIVLPNILLANVYAKELHLHTNKDVSTIINGSDSMDFKDYKLNENDEHRVTSEELDNAKKMLYECDDNEMSVGNLPIEEVNKKFKKFVKYMENGELKVMESSTPENINVYEKGTINSVAYSIYGDGSASFTPIGLDGYDKQWSIDCKKDKFNDLKVCHMVNNSLFVFLIGGKFSVSLGSNHFPNSSAAIKIDNNKTIYGIEGEFKNSIPVIEQLKRGKLALTRYQEWPYEINKDREVKLTGFNESLDYMKWAYKRL